MCLYVRLFSLEGGLLSECWTDFIQSFALELAILVDIEWLPVAIFRKAIEKSSWSFLVSVDFKKITPTCLGSPNSKELPLTCSEA